MDLEKFCQKFDLQIDELKKELAKIGIFVLSPSEFVFLFKDFFN